jgi:regulatory protein
VVSKAGTIREVSMRMLARRALSPAEVRERLLRKGFSTQEVAGELTRLRRLGIVEERELARAVVREQLRTGHGPRAAAAALRRRRIRGEPVDNAVAEIGPEIEAEAIARAVAKATRRHPQWRQLPEERRKVIRYLLARGFSAEQVSVAVRATGRDDIGPPENDDAGDSPDVP